MIRCFSDYAYLFIAGTAAGVAGSMITDGFWTGGVAVGIVSFVLMLRTVGEARHDERTRCVAECDSTRRIREGN